MAEFLGVGYLTVAAYALLPALLYYLAVFLAVHFEARLQGLQGLPRADLPRVGVVLRERGHLFAPLVIIIGTLMWGFSAPYAALMGILSVCPRRPAAPHDAGASSRRASSSRGWRRARSTRSSWRSPAPRRAS